MTRLERLDADPVAHYKDAVLDRLAARANVAQFASFEPGAEPVARYSRVGGFRPNHPFAVEEAIRALLEEGPEGSVNVRSFHPEQPKSHDFLYGLTRAEEAVAAVRRLAGQGLYTIVNETIDVADGGVSGVSYAGILEFAPGDTPRCVEKPGTASLPRQLGFRVLETVYGFRPELDQPDDVRVEFSIHPLKRGYRREHTVVWEEEETEALQLAAEIAWPNLFSRFLGDKAFGLVVADAFGLPVPAATVIPRGVAPFTVGSSTSSGEQWIRTCAVEPEPGRFTTTRGWVDPFALMAEEDPDGRWIASVLAQEGVDATFSGAALGSADGRVVIEGVSGFGDEFMLGRRQPEPLPSGVEDDVRTLYRRAAERLGAVRLEWAHDGSTVWVLQLQRGETAEARRTIYPGDPDVEHRFEVAEGLEALRALVGRIEGSGEGIVLVGNVGVTSHLGDVLRRARIPSRLEPTVET